MPLTGDVMPHYRAAIGLLDVTTRRTYTASMDFEWDERKRLVNIGLHGLDFVDAEPMFEGPMLTALDTRQDYGEDRWIGVGISNGRILVVAFAERNDGRTVRIISLRKALSHERKAFEEILGN